MLLQSNIAHAKLEGILHIDKTVFGLIEKGLSGSGVFLAIDERETAG